MITTRYLLGEHVPEQLIEKMFGIKQIDKDTSQFILKMSAILKYSSQQTFDRST